MRFIIVLSILFVMVLGCNAKHEPTKIDTTPVDSASIPAQSQHDSTSTGSDNPVDSHDSLAKANLGDSGWYTLTRDLGTFERCLSRSGCMHQNRRVLMGVETRSNAFGEIEIFCGNSNINGIDWVLGYRCDSNQNWAVCMEESCACGAETIKRNEACEGGVENGVFSAQSQRVQQVTDPIPQPVPEPAPVLVPQRTCGLDQGQRTDDGMYKAFRCLEQMESDNGCECTYESGYWFCDRPEGCVTRDGRRYRTLGSYPSALSRAETCDYFILGDVDTTVETVCLSGDCVLSPKIDPSLSLTQRFASQGIIPLGYSIVPDGNGEPCDAYEALDCGSKIEGFEVDYAQCEGGVRYCHGRSNPPIKAPENAQGYQCQRSPLFPKLKPDQGLEEGSIKTWMCVEKSGCVCGGARCPEGAMCIDEQCYCGDVAMSSTVNQECFVLSQIDDDGTKHSDAVLTCQDDQCPCGNGMCPKNGACIDNACSCRREPKPLDGDWACRTSGWRCNSIFGCSCGKDFVPFGGLCQNEIATCADLTDTLPGEGYTCELISLDQYIWTCASASGCACYGDHIAQFETCNYAKKFGKKCLWPNRLTPDGCLCGDKPLLEGYVCVEHANQTTVNVCDDETCKCGMNTCQTGMYCVHGRCVTPQLKDGEASWRYWAARIDDGAARAVVCKDTEGCFCGSNRCFKNDVCIDGQCYPAAWTFVMEGKRFSYDLSISWDATVSVLRGNWLPCAGQRLGEPDIQTTPIDYANSDQIDDYACVIDAQPYEVYDLELKCHRPDYCMCGQVRCPSKDTCACELVNDRLKCQCDAPDAVTQWPDETLGCYDTKIPQKHAKGYACVPGLGFVCNDSTGCACADVRCLKGAICIKPGACTDVVMP